MIMINIHYTGVNIPLTMVSGIISAMFDIQARWVPVWEESIAQDMMT